MSEIEVPTKEYLEETKKYEERRILLIKATFEKMGKILVSNGNFRGYTTFVEFEEFVRAGMRARRRIATNILRKAVAEYPGENDSDKHRRPNGSHMAFYDRANNRWIDYNIPARFIQDPQHPTTVEERMRAHWLKADRHPPGLFGIEIEFACEMKYDIKKVKWGRGVCDNGPECCPPIGPTEIKEIKTALPETIFRPIQDMIPGVRLKEDGSINPKHSDSQEANLLAGPGGFARLKKLCELIKERGGFINDTCAIHVHLDARKEDRRVAGIRADKLWDFMPVLKDLVPDARLNNKYCVIAKPGFDLDRRMAINLASYKEHKTIEVRLGSGSLHASKIWHWAHVLLYVSKSKERYRTWDEFLASNFPFLLRVWCVRRANELRPNEKLMRERINKIVPGLDGILNQDYTSDDVDIAKALKGNNV